MLLEDIDQHNLEKIKRECSEFIEHNNRPLFRGMRDRGSITHVPIRTDRKPLSTGVIDNILYNYLFELKFNVKDIRKKTSYVSTSENQAKNYGVLYVIFPINGTEMFFNPTVEDSAYMMKSIRNEFMDAVDYLANKNTQIDSILDELNKDDNIENIDSLIEEIEHYMMFMDIDIHRKELLNRFYNTAKKIREVSDYEVVDTKHKIPKSSSRMEVGLFGKPYYYAINTKELPPLEYYPEWLNSTLRK